MSLKSQSDSLVPADTQRVAKAVFKKGSPYVGYYKRCCHEVP